MSGGHSSRTPLLAVFEGATTSYTASLTLRKSREDHYLYTLAKSPSMKPSHSGVEEVAGLFCKRSFRPPLAARRVGCFGYRKTRRVPRDPCGHRHGGSVVSVGRTGVH